MATDIFGDLLEWEAVLEKLETLRIRGQLDAHKQGLARLVRYRRSPQLQRHALDCSLELTSSSDLLITDTLNILAFPDTRLDVRVSAAHAVGHLLSCYEDETGHSYFDVDRARHTLEHMADLCHPPPLAEALRQAVLTAKGSNNRAARPAKHRRHHHPRTP